MGERPRRSSLFEVGFPIAKDRGSSIVNIQPSIFEHRPQKVVFENTYKMEPDKKLDLKEIERLMQSTLESFLQNATYDASRCRSLVNSLSLTIREQVKLMDYKRYKVICLVNIVENKSQGIRIASRCLWDDKKDNQVSAVYCNTSLVCLATVFMVYCE
ncbi:tctex1 domain-containing protein 1-like [Dendronephthya gigantea]|uniref:tctex1 domain-containing protein 1-like n=1 Tax=Dendronephthya gigantea TaxID=151771 RepID=UPI00106CBBD8|nr:tctex1 domain-containing protein 1-like [Dendronephthya gigantea]